VRAGNLRHLIDIQQAIEIKDAYGAVTETWISVGKVRAGIYQLSGREYFAAQQINSEINAKLVIRYLGGLTTKMRAVEPGTTRSFDLQAIIDKAGMRRELEMLAIEQCAVSTSVVTTPYYFSSDFSVDFA